MNSQSTSSSGYLCKTSSTCPWSISQHFCNMFATTMRSLAADCSSLHQQAWCDRWNLSFTLTKHKLAISWHLRWPRNYSLHMVLSRRLVVFSMKACGWIWWHSVIQPLIKYEEGGAVWWKSLSSSCTSNWQNRLPCSVLDPTLFWSLFKSARSPATSMRCGVVMTGVELPVSNSACVAKIWLAKLQILQITTPLLWIKPLWDWTFVMLGLTMRLMICGTRWRQSLTPAAKQRERETKRRLGSTSTTWTRFWPMRKAEEFFQLAKFSLTACICIFQTEYAAGKSFISAMLWLNMAWLLISWVMLWSHRPGRLIQQKK